MHVDDRAALDALAPLEHRRIVDEQLAEYHRGPARLDPLPAGPKPPPPGLNIAPEKWATLDRSTRRALIRYHRNVVHE